MHGFSPKMNNGNYINRKTGFTIVELLIVIVVIAILAAISIVAFSGIQQRSRNAQIGQGVNSYIKAIRLYQADNGILPGATGCLGASYPSDQCWSGPSGNISVNVDLDNALAKYVSTKPVLSTKTLQITGGPDYRLGAVYSLVSQTDAKIIYYLEGSGKTCLNGQIGVTEMQGTQCSIIMNP